MIKSSIIRRLEVVENSKNSGIYIVIWGGLSPIYVQISKSIGTDFKTELKLFDSTEEAVQFVDNYNDGTNVVIVNSGQDVLSADLYRWSE